MTSVGFGLSIVEGSVRTSTSTRSSTTDTASLHLQGESVEHRFPFLLTLFAGLLTYAVPGKR